MQHVKFFNFSIGVGAFVVFESHEGEVWHDSRLLQRLLTLNKVINAHYPLLPGHHLARLHLLVLKHNRIFFIPTDLTIHHLLKLPHSRLWLLWDLGISVRILGRFGDLEGGALDKICRHIELILPIFIKND